MPFSENFTEQAYNGGGDPVITLLRVNVDGTYHYFCDNTESLTSSVSGTSQVYNRGAFTVKLPENSTEGTPTATLVFDAADIQIVRELRAANNRLVFDLWLVLASDPNTVEFGPVNYESVGFAVSSQQIQIELQAETILDIQIPNARFTPTLFPGLWAETD